MSNIKLAFFDVDGTLLNSQGEFSPLLRQKLLALKQQGVKLAIASGRPPFGCRFLIEELGLDDMGLFYTGGLIYCPASQQTLVQNTLEIDLARRVYHAAKSRGLYIEYYHRQGFAIESPHFIADEHSRHLRCKPEVISFDDYWGEEQVCCKLLLGEDSRLSHHLPELELIFDQCQFAYASLPSYPHWRFASVIPRQACKKRGFNQLLDYYQLSADQVMAIGDSQSDMQFVQLAGMGIAMGNATDELKQVASYTTAHTDKDGAYQALCHVFG